MIQLFSDEFLLTEDATKDTSLIPQCGQAGIKTCQAVNVDFRNLKDGQIVKLIQGSNIQMQVNLFFEKVEFLFFFFL